MLHQSHTRRLFFAKTTGRKAKGLTDTAPHVTPTGEKTTSAQKSHALTRSVSTLAISAVHGLHENKNVTGNEKKKTSGCAVQKVKGDNFEKETTSSDYNSGCSVFFPTFFPPLSLPVNYSDLIPRPPLIAVY